MFTYAYTAKDSMGRNVRGKMESENEDLLVETLHGQGLIVLNIKEQKTGVSSRQKNTFKDSLIGAFNAANEVSLSKVRVKTEDIVIFTSQMAAMIDGGMHLLNCLQSLAKESSNKNLSRVILQIREDVKAGATLFSSMQRYPKCFSNFYLGMIRAGESSGELAVVMNQLAEYLERTDALKRKVKSATAYPKFMLGFIFVSVMIIMTVVIPQFKDLYGKKGKRLPLPTEILVKVSDTITDNFFIVLPITCIVFFAIYWFFSKNKIGVELLDRFKLKMPVFGKVITKNIMARFSKTMGVLIRSGMSITDTLSISGAVCDNTVMTKACEAISFNVKQGKSLSAAMSDFQVFPDMVVQMVAAGEEVGMVDKMLLKSADFYEQQVDSTIKNISSLIEPLLIVVVGLIMGGILICLFLPIFELGKIMR